MATIWNETFEAAGYDNVWNGGEAVTAGNTLNEDYATAIAGWDSQCLRAIGIADGTDAYVFHELAGADNATTYTRIEVYPIDLSGFAAGEDMTMLKIYTGGFAYCYYLQIYNNGGTNYFRIGSFYDNTEHLFQSDNPAIINTKYTIEVYWQASTGFSWRVNGDDQGDTVTAPTFTSARAAGVIQVGVDGSYTICEILIDNVNINDTAFLGPTGGGTSTIPRYKKYYDYRRVP